MTDGLRAFIRRTVFLNEAMVSAAEAQKSGLALAFSEKGDEHYALLYDAGKARAMIESGLKSDGDTSDVLTSSLRAAARAMVMFSPPATGECLGAWEIRRAAAEKGLGPLMYYIALGAVPTHAIMPDRHDVSDSAGSIWAKFAGVGGIEKLKLDDEENPQTPPTDDDCKLIHDPKRQFLDFAYRQKSGGTSVAGLTSVHDELVSDIGFEHESIGDGAFDSAVAAAARAYFESRYS